MKHTLEIDVSGTITVTVEAPTLKDAIVAIEKHVAESDFGSLTDVKIIASRIVD